MLRPPEAQRILNGVGQRNVPPLQKLFRREPIHVGADHRLKPKAYHKVALAGAASDPP